MNNNLRYKMFARNEAERRGRRSEDEMLLLMMIMVKAEKESGKKIKGQNISTENRKRVKCEATAHKQRKSDEKRRLMIAWAKTFHH